MLLQAVFIVIAWQFALNTMFHLYKLSNCMTGKRPHWPVFLQVKMIDALETMESSEFANTGRNWSCVLSDGSITMVKVDGEGNAVPLKYDDRDRYCSEVRRIRMAESDEQVRLSCYVLVVH